MKLFGWIWKLMKPKTVSLDMVDSAKLGGIEGWKDLWQQGIFPWHSSDINPKLQANFKNLIEMAGKSKAEECRFFVPLCGKTKDLLFLRSQGFQVVGCEGVEQACLDFFKENAIEYERKEENGNVNFANQDGSLKLICGDYFALSPEKLGGKFDCVWDRGSLVAIPLEKREE